jgi:tetratricopeptide (TPR) repeat protein
MIIRSIGLFHVTGRRIHGWDAIVRLGFKRLGFKRPGSIRLGLMLAAAISVALLAAPARAQTQKDIGDCSQSPDVDRRIAACTRALAGNLKSPAVVFVSRGQAFAVKGDYDRAMADMNEAIRADATYSRAYYLRGAIWENKGLFDQAIADYTAAIRFDDKAYAAYNDRGETWFHKGEYDRAIADYNEAIRINPKYAGAYAERGECWRLKGDLARALADQDEAIRLLKEGDYPDPSYRAGFYVTRGDTLRYAGFYARALADFDEALRLDPGHGRAFTGRGLTYEKMGDFVHARIEFAKAIASITPARETQIYYREGVETARARLAALDSGAAQPAIPAALQEATSATSIPTPLATVPAIVTEAARQGRRVALVIGNSAYQNVPALINPQKDATAIAASLRNIGFDVVMVNDVTREKMIDSLRSFANEAERSEWAVVYYAGHGMEVGGINYLVPVDARIAVDRDIQYEAVPLSQILNAADTAKKIKLVMLDACRDNPFTPRKTAAPEVVAAAVSTAGAPITTRSSNGRGLAEVKVTGATLVVYAAKDGQVALDGETGNSPLAVAVTQRLATPGVEINKIFRLVRDDVMEATAGRQEPYTYGSLPGKEDFFFVAK